MTERICSVVNAIPYGKERPITRQELALRLGTSDREARKMIQEARAEGYMIQNHGNGYFQSDDIQDIERQYRRDRSQALSILVRLKRSRAILKEAGIQV